MFSRTVVAHRTAVGRTWVQRATHGWRSSPSLSGEFDADPDAVNVRLAYGNALLHMASGEEQTAWVLDYAADVLGASDPTTVDMNAMGGSSIASHVFGRFEKALEQCSWPQRGETANCFLYDAVRMMIVDGQYSTLEKKAIRTVALRLHVPQSLIQEIERVAEEEAALDALKASIW